MGYLDYFRLFSKILPLTYEEGISYEKQLQKIIAKVKELIEAAHEDYGEIATGAQEDLDSYSENTQTAISNASKAGSKQISAIREGLQKEIEARKSADSEIQEKIENAKNAPVEEKPLNRLYIICGDSLMLGENGWGKFMEKAGVNLATNLDAISEADLSTPLSQLERIKENIDADLVTNIVLIGNINSLEDASDFPSKAREKFPNANILIANIQDSAVGEPLKAEIKAEAEKAGAYCPGGLEGILCDSEISASEKARILGSIALGFISPYLYSTKATYTAYSHEYTTLECFASRRKLFGIGVGEITSPDTTNLKDFAKKIPLEVSVGGATSQSPGFIKCDLSEENPTAKRNYVTISSGVWTETTENSTTAGLYGEVIFE